MAERFGIGVALLLGILVRGAPVVSAGGVVGDGGLILALIDDLRAGGLALPTTTTYNDLGIPFVYPPLALLIAAGLGSLTGAATMDLLTWLPFVVSVLVLGAFAWLATRVLPPVAAVGATLAFAIMPSAYGWLVAAGGLTRAAGLLFALLAAAVVAGPRPQSYRSAAAAGLLLGLAGLSHPQAPIFGAIACIVLSWRAPFAGWLRNTAVAAGVAALVITPWVAWLVANDGVTALVGAGQRFEPLTGIIRMLNLRFSAAPFMDVAGVLGAIGLVMALLRREWRIPTLLIAISVSGAGGGEFLASVPWALLAGIGTAAVVDLGRSALDGTSRKARRRMALAVGGSALFLALIGSLGSVVDRSSKLHPLGEDLVAAMVWLDTNFDGEASIIAPATDVWGYDEVSEWLPALSARRSVGTVQGSEWLGSDGFEEQLATHAALLDCAGETVACYERIDPASVIFVPKGQLAGPFSPTDCCPALRETLNDVGYEVIYDGPGATIAQPSGLAGP